MSASLLASDGARRGGSSYPRVMTSFGGLFRSPKLEGVEESDDNGERGRVVGLDLDSGVVRLRAAPSEPPGTQEPQDSPEE